MSPIHQAIQSIKVRINESHNNLKIDLKDSSDESIKNYFNGLMRNQIVIMENQQLLLNNIKEI